MATFRSCILIILFFIICHCQAAVITVPPAPVTAPIYTTATFSCEGTGDILNWWIQSSVLTDSVKQQREISVTTTTVNNTNFSSVLTVNAIPINDGLGIGCEVITFNLSNPFNPFERVTSNSVLTIRGVSPVEDIQYTFLTNTTLLITWLPPAYYSYDIPVELVGSLLSYHVLVRLVTEHDEEYSIIFNEAISTNIEVNEISECDTFNISITALLDQYISISNTISNNGSLGYNATIKTNRNNSQTPNVSIELSCPPSKSNSSLTITSGSKVISHYEINGSDNVFNYDTRTLAPSNKYNYTVRVCNVRNKLEYETYYIITIYKVIGLYINNTYTNGSVSVQCIFAESSTADGCHLIFTHTETGRNESFNVTGSNNTILSVSIGGVYTVTGFDIDNNGSLYGPAIEYPTLVEVIKVIPSTSTSSSNIHESTLPPQSTTVVSHTITTTVINPTATTSSTSETINDTNDYIVHFVAGTVSGSVLLILIILAVCGFSVYKRKKMKVKVLIRSEIATAQQPQAETNQYQDVHELRNEVPITTSPVLLTSGRLINEENPYHATRSEFLPNYHTIPLHNVESQLRSQCDECPSPASTTTQETTVDDSISSTTSNNIHDGTYTTDPTNATDTITATANNEATTVNYTAAAMATVNDTVTATYASIAKRTDTAVPPAVDQRVEYDTVTGHINKSGEDVTVYPPDDISAIPPPPSYAATIAQECGATVSSSQFKVPEQETDAAAVVHGQYEKYPPAYTGDEYGMKTPVQDQSNSTDAEAVQPSASIATLDSNFTNDRKGGSTCTIDEPPMNGKEISLIQFRETGENVSIKKSLLVDGLFEEDEIFYNHIVDHISDEMVGVKPCPVVFITTKETGTLVTGVTSKAEVVV